MEEGGFHFKVLGVIDTRQAQFTLTQDEAMISFNLTMILTLRWL